MTTTIINIEQKLDREITSLFNHSKMGNTINSNTKELTFDEFLADKMLIISAIRVGIPYSLFELIQQEAPFSENDWAEFLGISLKSLQRYKSVSKSFKPIHSEKIIGIAEVTKAGVDTFGNIDKFKLWLNTPSFALGRMSPRDLLKDSYGKDLILAELTRINHGIFV